jgi:hypothetical protein
MAGACQPSHRWYKVGAALQAQVLDVGAGGLRYPQPVQREQRDQRDQRVSGWRAEPGGDEQRAELVAVQRDGM